MDKIGFIQTNDCDNDTEEVIETAIKHTIF